MEVFRVFSIPFEIPLVENSDSSLESSPTVCDPIASPIGPSDLSTHDRITSRCASTNTLVLVDSRLAAHAERESTPHAERVVVICIQSGELDTLKALHR